MTPTRWSNRISDQQAHRKPKPVVKAKKEWYERSGVVYVIWITVVQGPSGGRGNLEGGSTVLSEHFLWHIVRSNIQLVDGFILKL